nr:hypothetical protein CFP56_62752 [Quercus suber]
MSLSFFDEPQHFLPVRSLNRSSRVPRGVNLLAAAFQTPHLAAIDQSACRSSDGGKSSWRTVAGCMRCAPLLDRSFHPSQNFTDFRVISEWIGGHIPLRCFELPLLSKSLCCICLITNNEDQDMVSVASNTIYRVAIQRAPKAWGRHAQADRTVGPRLVYRSTAIFHSYRPSSSTLPTAMTATVLD